MIIFAALCVKRANIGDLSEWLKEHAWKVCIPARVSRVRIPQSPLRGLHQEDPLFLYISNPFSFIFKRLCDTKPNIAGVR